MLDVTQFLTAPTDVIANSSPSIANGADLQFEFLLSYGPATDDTTIVSTANLASLYVQLKVSTDKDGLDLWQGAGSVSATAFDAGITYADWEAGIAQQVLVQIPASANQILLTSDQQQFWMVIYAETTDSPAKMIPVCSFPVLVVNTGLGVVPPAYVVPVGYYNKAESDARFAVIGATLLISSGVSYTGATDPNTAMLAGKAGDMFVMIVGGVYIKTMVKTTGTFAVPTTGGWQ